MGYGIIAVPTGILTNEMAVAMRKKETRSEACLSCGREGHDVNAKFCEFCGAEL